MSWSQEGLCSPNIRQIYLDSNDSNIKVCHPAKRGFKFDLITLIFIPFMFVWCTGPSDAVKKTWLFFCSAFSSLQYPLPAYTHRHIGKSFSTVCPGDCTAGDFPFTPGLGGNQLTCQLRMSAATWSVDSVEMWAHM